MCGRRGKNLVRVRAGVRDGLRGKNLVKVGARVRGGG